MKRHDEHRFADLPCLQIENGAGSTGRAGRTAQLSMLGMRPGGSIEVGYRGAMAGRTAATKVKPFGCDDPSLEAIAFGYPRARMF